MNDLDYDRYREWQAEEERQWREEMINDYCEQCLDNYECPCDHDVEIVRDEYEGDYAWCPEFRQPSDHRPPFTLEDKFAAMLGGRDYKTIITH